MFTCNTWDSSGVNPEGKARGIYIWTVLCIIYKHRLGVVWLACTTAGIQNIIMLLFYQTEMLRRATSGSRSIIMLVVSQQTSRWSFHAFCAPWPCSILPPGTLSRASSDSRSSARTVGAGRLLIVLSMNNITGPTNARTEPSCKLNCTQQGEVGGYRLNKFHGATQYSPLFQLPNFADSVWCNYHVLLTLLIFLVYVI